MKTFDQFTDLENIFLNGIKDSWGSTGMHNTYLSDVSEVTNIPNSQGRGIISSLIKKGIILECLPQYGFEINLTEKGHKLLNIED